MRLSPYLKIFPHPTKPGWSVLFSTRKGSLALLPDKAVQTLKAAQALSDQEMRVLAKMGFITDDPAAEQALVLGMLEEVNRLSAALNVAVILTLDCNFACRYCYEGTQKNKRYMTEETASQLVQFLKSQFKPNYKKLTLAFYGGEPLLAKEQIKQIAAPLKEFAEEQGAEFHFTLITNGSLLTRPMVEELTPIGLRSAKVTLDGPAELHNQSRPFKSGQGSFGAIVKNVRECCELLQIGIQGNCTRDNYQRFPELLDLLEQEGIGPDRLLMVLFGPVLQTSDEFALAEFHDGCRSLNEDWVIEASLLLREETLKRGYRVHKLSPSPCMVDLENEFTVHVDGSLYKCMAFIGHPEYGVGDIWQGMKDYREVYKLDHWRRNPECRDCCYLPLCFGGCRYTEFQRHGRIKGVDCQKEYWDGALEKLVLQGVRWPQKQS